MSQHIERAPDDSRVGTGASELLAKNVLDSVAVPAGNDPLGNPWCTAFHLPSDSNLLAQLDAG